jgi:phosphoribosylamine---glycine ligase
VVEHRLDQFTVEWHDDCAVCVVMTSDGYPGSYETGKAIHGLAEGEPSATVFHAGTVRKGSDVVTAGGRVLGVTGRGPTIAEAQQAAYRRIQKISFAGQHFRTDIAHRALRHSS